MAQTFKFGKGTWANKKGSTLAYNDENENYKPLPFNFTRASIATRVNKAGLIEVVGNDQPRIDYTDSSEGVLLLENAATNKFIYSNQFDTNWITSQGSLLSGQTGVGGSLDAWKFTDNTSTGEHFVRQTPSVGGVVSISVYAKAGTNDFLYLRGVASGVNVRTWFNLKTGVVGTIQSTSAIMKSMGNGWYRCTMVFTHDTAFEYYIAMSNADGVSSYQGDGTGSIFIQYAQLEQTSLPTSYIPTNGSAVTRSAETCNGSGNSEVFNDSEGVLFANVASLSQVGTSRVIASLSNGSSTANRLVLQYTNSASGNEIVAFAQATSYSSVLTRSIPNSTLYGKFALKYSDVNNTIDLYLNGFNIGTGTWNYNFPTNSLNKIQLADANSTGNPLFGKTKEIGYYNTALTDAELETLTSYRNWVTMVNELNLNIIYNG